MEYLADTPSGDPMHWAYIESGAVYNATAQDVIKQAPWGEVIHKAGMWYLNGLGDITNREMNRIYSKSNMTAGIDAYASFLAPIERTNICEIAINSPYSCRRFAFGNIIIESIATYKYSGNPYVNDYNESFYNCSKLKYINTEIFAKYAQGKFIDTFRGCKSLEHVMIYGLNTNVSFSDSPLLSNKSIANMVNKADISQSVVITLHADTYARAMADASVQAALAAKPNVSLASV